ncbi:MAG: hypothetical protein ACOYNZ_18045, partial [Rhodoferax sp.]
GKVSKEAILAYLDANGVKVQEVVLGGDIKIDLQEATFAEAKAEAESGGYVVMEGGGRINSDRAHLMSENHTYYVNKNKGRSDGPSKYRSYQLPGGSNYREVLLTLPSISSEQGRRFQELQRKYEGDPKSLSEKEMSEYMKSGDSLSTSGYKSSHWDQKNVLSHIRLNDRTDADGAKVLFVEELQSDWGQTGKKRGFKTKYTPDQVTEIQPGSEAVASDPARFWYFKTPDNTLQILKREHPTIEDARNYVINEKAPGEIPTAPFVQKTDAWLSLAIKRVIKMAVDGGYDKVAFINGEQSAARYDLSKHADQLIFDDGPGGRNTLIMRKDGANVMVQHDVAADKLADYVGKDLAVKLQSAPVDEYGRKSLSGIDLKAGGEGMVAFYDTIVPNIAKDVLRKLGGGKMEAVSINDGRYGVQGRNVVDLENGEHLDSYRTQQDALKALAKKALSQPGFTITPALAEKVSGGMPQFSKREIVGETKRKHTVEQLKAFGNVGWEVEVPSLKERAKAIWKDAGKKMAQGIADQFAPVKELSLQAYGLLRLAKGAAGSFETILRGGLLKLNDGVYDFDEAKRGGAVDKWLIPMQGEHHDHLRWIAANRAETLMNKSEADQAKGLVLLAEADALAAQAKALDTKAKDYLQQAGNFPKSMTGNQLAQKKNLVEANKLMADAKRLRAEAAEKRTQGNELKKVSLENLFTREDIAAIKTLSDGDLNFDFTLLHGPKAGSKTRSRAEMYADSLATFNEFNKNVMDMAEQSGLIDGEARKMWEGEFYVPFYRVVEDNAVSGGHMSGGAVRQQAFKKLKGGTDKLNADLLDNTLRNWAHLLDASAKNRAAKATLEAAEKVGVAVNTTEEAARQMGKAIGNKNGVVWFMDQGKQRYFLVDDPYVLTAISSLEYAGMNGPMMKAMGAMKNMLTVGVTASPFFKVRNLIRDSIQVIGTGNISYNPGKNLKDGWALTNPKNDIYFRLLAGGGTIHFGTMLEGSEAKRVQALTESGIDAATILGDEHKVKAFYRKYLEPAFTAYNELGNRGEAINRAALYDQLVKQGVSHADASLQARDLMDFSMAGSWATVRFLTQIVPFMNARIQGAYKLGRAAKEDPKRMAYVTGAIAVASLALLAAYGDDDDWKKREDWDRNNFYWFKFGGIAFRIPKPFELGA